MYLLFDDVLLLLFGGTLKLFNGGFGVDGGDGESNVIIDVFILSAFTIDHQN